MFVPTDDAHKDFDRYDREQAERLRRRPVCIDCGEPIQGRYAYKLAEGLYCPDCIKLCEVRLEDYDL